MSNYPDRSENDPNAPWNLPDPKMVECENCEGTGWHEAETENENDQKCDHCEGTGEVEVDDDND